MTIQPITYDLLREKGACAGQRKIFRCVFGESAPLVVEAATENAQGFDWDWAARRLLSDAARAAYAKARASASDAYDEAAASARDAYNKARASASDAYNKATASAWDAYLKATASAWGAYAKARAEAFARAYLSQENDQ